VSAAREDEADRQAETVRTSDGTAIGYWRSGDGPPLVLVHGAAADHGRWRPILPALEAHFTVYAVDRRGRGASGDATSFDVEHEFADVGAVVEAIGGPVDVLGHSYGALCALEAALRTRAIRRLVLYEPPIPVAGQAIYPPSVIERMDAQFAAGDRDGVVETTLREVAGLPAATVAHLRTLPPWQARVAAAHTIPRELRATDAYRFDPGRFQEVEAPTLLLLGDASPPVFAAGTHALAEALPDARVVVLPGQGHAAMDTGTDLFTTEVLRFLTAG
jgi:pimeloyl-ACP methyl ester carboxylesterase